MLTALAENNRNPKGILISDENTFVSDPAIQTVTEHRAFKPSELSFKLPETLHNEFKTHLNIAQQQSETSNAKLNELIELEETLTQSRLELEKEKADFRSGLQNQVEQLEATLANERTMYQEEIKSLQEKLEQFQKENASFQEEAKAGTEAGIQDTLDDNQETLEETSNIENELQSLRTMMENLTREDKERVEQKKMQSKGYKSEPRTSRNTRPSIIKSKRIFRTAPPNWKNQTRLTATS